VIDIDADKGYAELREILRLIEEKGELPFNHKAKGGYVGRRDIDGVARLRNYPEIFTLFK
jgi:hypothetical protein